MTANGSADPSKAGQKTTAPPRKSSWFSLPPALRRIFDTFPLITYDINRLPQRAPRVRDEHTLYIFTSPDNSFDGPSCNPSCLKWQTYLRFKKVKLRQQSSSNHASPFGALPFLLPANDGRPKSPVPATKIPKWLTAQGQEEEKPHIQEEAYMALIDHSIRNAWLYCLYVDKSNFDAVARPLYVETASRSSAVQAATAWQLRAAAIEELGKSGKVIDGEELYERADEAFSALSTMLGGNDWFFGVEEPGLFDASLFAYTFLLLDREVLWKDRRMIDMVRSHENLVRHCDRIREEYFANPGP